MGKISNNKKGIVLVYVMTIGLAVLFLMSALLVAVSVGAGTTKRSARERQAYLNAKSGAEYAMACLQKELYVSSLPKEDFFVYGETGDLHFIGESDYNKGGINREDYEIFARAAVSSCAIVYQGGGINVDMEIDIDSTGRENNAAYSLRYKTDISARFRQVFPAFPQNVEEAAHTIRDDAKWYDYNSYSDSAIIDKSPGNAYVAGNAVFPHTTLVDTNGSKTTPYTADQIWFTKDDVSISVSKNKSITMASNLFVFMGDVVKDSGSQFYIKPHEQDSRMSPLISGYALSRGGYSTADTGVNYGLVYFGPGVSCAGAGLGGETGRFYFFPEDTNLFSSGDRSKLLPVSDFTIFYTDQFNGQVGFSSGEPPVSLSIGGAVQ